MSNGGPPDVNAALLQWQQSTIKQTGGAPIALGLDLNWNVTGQFDLTKAAPLQFDSKIRPTAQVPDGPVRGLLKQMGLSGRDKFAVKEASHEDLFGQAGPAGGSFVSAATGPSHGDDGPGVG